MANRNGQTIFAVVADAAEEGVAWGVAFMSLIVGFLFALPLAIVQGIFRFLEGSILSYVDFIQLKETEVNFTDTVKAFFVKLGTLIGILAMLEGLSLGILIYQCLYTYLGNELGFAIGVGFFLGFFMLFSKLDSLIVRSTLKDTSDGKGTWAYWRSMGTMVSLRLVWLVVMPLYTSVGLALMIDAGDIEDHINRQEMVIVDQIKADQNRTTVEDAVAEVKKLEARRKSERDAAKIKFDEASAAHQKAADKIRAAIASNTDVAILLNKGADNMKKALDATQADDAKWLEDNDLSKRYDAIDTAVNAQLARVKDAEAEKLASVKNLSKVEVAERFGSDWVVKRTYNVRKATLDQLGTSSSVMFLKILMLALGLMVFLSKTQAPEEVLWYFDIMIRSQSGDEKAKKLVEKRFEARRALRELEANEQIAREKHLEEAFLRAAAASAKQKNVERDEKFQKQKELWTEKYGMVLDAFHSLMASKEVMTPNTESNVIIGLWVKFVSPELSAMAKVESSMIILGFSPPQWPENSPMKDPRGNDFDIVQMVIAWVPGMTVERQVRDTSPLN